MVINISALKSGQYDLVERDIAGVVEVARRYEAPVKAILETYLLTDEEKVAACRIAERAGAAFVKASGYVTDIDKVLALYEAGARRFGTACTVNIPEGLRKKLAEESRAASGPA